MGNCLKIKKRRIIVTFLLIFNQLILSSSYALGNRKLEINELEQNKLPLKYGQKSKVFISSKKRNETNSKKEVEELEKFADQIDEFVEETFDPNNLNHLKNQEANNPIFETNPNSVKEKVLKPNIKNKKVNIERKSLLTN